MKLQAPNIEGHDGIATGGQSDTRAIEANLGNDSEGDECQENELGGRR
jgi:hypothetical protein